MEKKLRLMLRIIKAVIEIFEMELDERIERMKKNERELEESSDEGNYHFNRDYNSHFTNED